MKTTLYQIQKCEPCINVWDRLIAGLGKKSADEESLTIVQILENNGVDDAIWALQAVTGHEREKRLIAARFARRVQHLMLDKRSILVLDVAERHAHGEATDAQLAAARDAAWDAARAARAAAWAERDAAMAAAWAAARAAEIDAASAAAMDVASAARAAASAAASAAARAAAIGAASAASAAAMAAAWDAERNAQADILRDMCAIS